MKQFYRVFVTSVLTLLPWVCFSQSEAGAIFLMIQPSPVFNGMGEIGVALPSSDPMASYHNPANGLFGYEDVGIQYAQYSTPWLRNLADDMYYSYSVTGIGIHPKSSSYYLAITHSKTDLDLGLQRMTDEYGNLYGYFKSSMLVDMNTIAAGYRWENHFAPLRLSAGFSAKNVDQYLTFASSNSDLYDFGLLISTDFSTRFDRVSSLEFRLSPALGYSLVNFGDEIAFNTVLTADPAPRAARAGFSLTTGAYLTADISLFEFRFGHAAEDLLIAYSTDGNNTLSYQKGLGDIGIYRNILLNEADSSLITQRGYEFVFLNFYSRRWGHHTDLDGSVDLFESGWSVDMAGLLQLTSQMVDNDYLRFLANHLILEYHYSQWNTEELFHPVNGTEYSVFYFGLNNLLSLK